MTIAWYTLMTKQLKQNTKIVGLQRNFIRQHAMKKKDRLSTKYSWLNRNWFRNKSNRKEKCEHVFVACGRFKRCSNYCERAARKCVFLGKSLFLLVHQTTSHEPERNWVIRLTESPSIVSAHLLFVSAHCVTNWKKAQRKQKLKNELNKNMACICCYTGYHKRASTIVNSFQYAMLFSKYLFSPLLCRDRPAFLRLLFLYAVLK